MKTKIAVSILLLLNYSFSFSQGQYLVTKAFISEYDSTINIWTQAVSFELRDYDGVVHFNYLDSISYVVSESEYRYLQKVRRRSTKKLIRNSAGETEVKKSSPHFRKTYSLSINLQSPIELDSDSCYSKYTASINENGTRLGSDYFATIKNNISKAEVKLISCSSIGQFTKAIIKNGVIDIIINQAPQSNKPFSKWRLQLEICRVPQYEYD